MQKNLAYKNNFVIINLSRCRGAILFGGFYLATV